MTIEVPIEKINVISNPKNIEEMMLERTIDKDVANPIYFINFIDLLFYFLR